MKKKVLFFTKEPDGTLSPLDSVEVEVTEKKSLFKKAVACLYQKTRDMHDFLHIKGNHLYFWNRRVTVEIP